MDFFDSFSLNSPIEKQTHRKSTLSIVGRYRFDELKAIKQEWWREVRFRTCVIAIKLTKFYDA